MAFPKAGGTSRPHGIDKSSRNEKSFTRLVEATFTHLYWDGLMMKRTSRPLSFGSLDNGKAADPLER